MGGDGIFAKYQPRYAEQNVITFPVNIIGKDKVPAITNYQRVGYRASAQLVTKFGDANAIGCMLGARSGKTILDLDCPGDAALADALAEHGDTPYIVRTISGGHHLFYKYGGEGRRIRPWGDDVRKDVLGGGFTVLAPSIGANGQYEVIRGTLDDLANLPPLHAVLDNLRRGPVPQGVRNTTVFHRLLREARHCDDFDSLLDVARSLNMDCIPALTDTSVLATAKKVWEYETNGNNWVGRKARASTDREEILAFRHDPYAAHLLSLLRVSHPTPDAVFAIDQVKTSKLLEWSRQTLGLRIRALMNAGHLKCIYVGKGLGDPHLYQLTHRRPK